MGISNILKLIALFYSIIGSISGAKFVDSAESSLSKHPTVLVVSFDGFRYDYMDKTATPFLHQLKSEGVSVPWMEPRFPSLTHPNYQSINTGLYPESHGVIANFLFDPLHNTTLTGNNDNPLFWNFREDILPLHVWNEKAGDGRHSGTYRWQGASTGYGPNSDLIATHRVPTYNASDPWENRVSTVLSWLTNATHPANLVFLYWNEPDTQGHSFSPDSLEEEGLWEIVRKIDSSVGHLVSELKSVGIYDLIDIIIVSDHGMETIRESTIINTTDFSDPTLYINYGSSPLYQLKINGSDEDVQKVFDDFSVAAETLNFSVFKKEEMVRFNYSGNRRIQDILLLADPGYAFEDNYKYLNEKMVSGVHGYDNKARNMQAFFMGRGPSFKKGYHSPSPINNVDLVPMICKILGIPEPPNNGSLSNTQNLFSTTNSGSKHTNEMLSFCIILITLILNCIHYKYE